MIRLGGELDAARSGPVEAYAEVLERALVVCDDDREAAAYLDELELHDELAEAYDRLGRVEGRCFMPMCWPSGAMRVRRIRGVVEPRS